MTRQPSVYLLASKRNGTLYCGVTANLIQRVWQHKNDFVEGLFQSLFVRRELGKLSSGTSASMRNISQGKLFHLQLPVAPYSEQKAFAERAAAAQSILSQQSAPTAKAQAAFDALLARAFSRDISIAV